MPGDADDGGATVSLEQCLDCLARALFGQQRFLILHQVMIFEATGVL